MASWGQPIGGVRVLTAMTSAGRAPVPSGRRAATSFDGPRVRRRQHSHPITIWNLYNLSRLRGREVLWARNEEPFRGCALARSPAGRG